MSAQFQGELQAKYVATNAAGHCAGHALNHYGATDATPSIFPLDNLLEVAPVSCGRCEPSWLGTTIR